MKAAPETEPKPTEGKLISMEEDRLKKITEDIEAYGEQKFKGVGGHLFAIASEFSVMSGFDGTVYGEAMDQEILEYYMEHFGANRLPKVIHPYAVAVNGVTAKRIREVYDYDWSDEIL
jgi:hypothetical protein